MTEEMNWFDDDKEIEMDKVTLSQFESLIEKAYIQKAKVDQMDEELKVESEKFEKLKARVCSFMNHFNKTNYKTQFGMVVKSSILSVKVEDKKAFSGFLREKGIFDDYVTFNNQKVVGLCKEEIEHAKKEGAEFGVPGVTKPEYIDRVSFRKS